jgi:hypothetical protein
MEFWILAALAISAASVTLSKSRMMLSYRRLMRRIHPEVWYLSRCHYCTSHWLSAAVVAVYTPVVRGTFWVDMLLAWLALVGASAIVSGVILFFTPFGSEE